MAIEIIKNQTIASIVDNVNNIREQELIDSLSKIAQERIYKLNIQDECFNNAINKVEAIRTEISNPTKILGSDLTKHGEIAEKVEVGIRNARNALKGLSDNSTFENVGRTAPEDYICNGLKVQSKFINGTNNTLKHVLEHMDKYEYFGRDGQTLYHIPRDQYDILMKIRNGEDISGLSQRSINALRDKIQEIESLTNKSFEDVVKPSISKYEEVQTNKVNETLDNHKSKLANENEEIKDTIKEKSERDKEVAKENGKASFGEATKVAGIAAAVSGGLSIATNVYKKKKEGKGLIDYTTEDWKEIGLDAGEKSLKGGITGYSIYGLTNFTSMSAPMAGAAVSSVFGFTALYSDYRKQNIDFEEFVMQSEALCFEVGLVALGSVIGQTVIPIPVVGTLVGSIVTSVLIDLGKGSLNQKEKVEIEKYRKRYEDYANKLGETLRLEYNNIMERYNMLGEVMEYAFSFEINSRLRFDNSIELANTYKVEKKKILKDMNEIDNYFM